MREKLLTSIYVIRRRLLAMEMCVVALVRGEVCAGTLARRTPPHWDGALDSALGKSFTTRPIHHALWSGRGVEGRARARAIGTIQGQIQAPVRRSSRDGLQRLVQPLGHSLTARAALGHD